MRIIVNVFVEYVEVRLGMKTRVRDHFRIKDGRKGERIGGGDCGESLL